MFLVSLLSVHISYHHCPSLWNSNPGQILKQQNIYDDIYDDRDLLFMVVQGKAREQDQLQSQGYRQRSKVKFTPLLMHRPNALNCVLREHEPFMKIAILSISKSIQQIYCDILIMILSLQGIFTLMPVAYFQFYSPPLSPHDLRNYRGPPAVNH